MTAQQLSREELDQLKRLQRPQCLEDRNAHIVYVPRDHPDSGKLIDSLFAAALKGIEADWQPIETAPKDTMVFTLWDGVNNKTGKPARYHVVAFHDSDRGEWVDEWGDDVDEPTHWKPLPKAPKAGEREEVMQSAPEANDREDSGSPGHVAQPSQDTLREPVAAPICCVTGRIAGDRFACGDCDPCILGAAKVSEPVKTLMRERDEFMDKYEEAMTGSPPTASEGAGKSWKPREILDLQGDPCWVWPDGTITLVGHEHERPEPAPTSSPPVGEETGVDETNGIDPSKEQEPLETKGLPVSTKSPDLDVDGLVRHAFKIAGSYNNGLNVDVLIDRRLLFEIATALQTREEERLEDVSRHELELMAVEEERDSLRKDVERLEGLLKEAQPHIGYLLPGANELSDKIYTALKGSG